MRICLPDPVPAASKLGVSELLDSDGLDDSSEAEEGSELCSILTNSMYKLRICQTEQGNAPPKGEGFEQFAPKGLF